MHHKTQQLGRFASLPMYILCEPDPPSVKLIFLHHCDTCGLSWESPIAVQVCPLCGTITPFYRVNRPTIHADSVLPLSGIDAGGPSEGVQPVPPMVRAALQGHRVRPLRGFFHHPIADFGITVWAATAAPLSPVPFTPQTEEAA
jgi:hypothetical protein